MEDGGFLPFVPERGIVISDNIFPGKAFECPKIGNMADDEGDALGVLY